jgi:membrane fusion protein (multidrug efflux system)
MKNIASIFILITTVLIASCGSKTGNTELTDKKAKLEELKKQQSTLNDEIVKLESDIVKLDPSAAKKENAKLVATATIAKDNFAHYIDLQGKIDAVNIAYITPRGQGGQVKELFVKKGDAVKKGQLILKVDDVVIKRQLEQLQTQLSFAKDLYQRQQNLWKENIGTEVQLLQAKNSVDNLEKQISIVKEQLAFTNVYAEMNGVLDEVNVKVGELFAGAGQIKLVNTNDLKVAAQVPENYLEKVKVGTHVKVTLPDLNKTVDAVISVAGKLIDPLSRSFYVEAKLPADNMFRPNQVAQVKILDYANANAITVPVNTLQTDDKGKFVMVATTENGKKLARKKLVSIGELYGDKIEVKSGLQIGDVLVTEGYQSLFDGQSITTELK